MRRGKGRIELPQWSGVGLKRRSQASNAAAVCGNFTKAQTHRFVSFSPSIVAGVKLPQSADARCSHSAIRCGCCRSIETKHSQPGWSVSEARSASAPCSRSGALPVSRLNPCRKCSGALAKVAARFAPQRSAKRNGVPVQSGVRLSAPDKCRDVARCHGTLSVSDW